MGMWGAQACVETLPPPHPCARMHTPSHAPAPTHACACTDSPPHALLQVRSAAVWTYRDRVACVMSVVEEANQRPVSEGAKLQRLQQLLLAMVDASDNGIVKSQVGWAWVLGGRQVVGAGGCVVRSLVCLCGGSCRRTGLEGRRGSTPDEAKCEATHTRAQSARTCSRALCCHVPAGGEGVDPL